jgi:hypothetical protein
MSSEHYNSYIHDEKGYNQYIVQIKRWHWDGCVPTSDQSFKCMKIWNTIPVIKLFLL